MQDLPGEAEKLIRSYRVPVRTSNEEALGKLLNSIGQKDIPDNVPRRKITWYMWAASVAATIAIFVTVWLFTASETVSSPSGDIYAFRLPDNSRVVLHDGSAITFRKYFWNSHVNLQGEAYFEVEKGNDFRVMTSNGEVEVLGTRFLVKEKESRFEVKCYQGKVRAGYISEDWILESGIEVVATGEKAEKKQFSETPGYPAFARFSASFENMPVSDVMKEVERFFGVNIRLEVTADKRFSGSVETGSLDNVLRIVSEPLGLHYVFEDTYRIKVYN